MLRDYFVAPRFSLLDATDEENKRYKKANGLFRGGLASALIIAAVNVGVMIEVLFTADAEYTYILVTIFIAVMFVLLAYGTYLENTFVAVLAPIIFAAEKFYGLFIGGWRFQFQDIYALLLIVGMVNGVRGIAMLRTLRKNRRALQPYGIDEAEAQARHVSTVQAALFGGVAILLLVAPVVRVASKNIYPIDYFFQKDIARFVVTLGEQVGGASASAPAPESLSETVSDDGFFKIAFPGTPKRSEEKGTENGGYTDISYLLSLGEVRYQVIATVFADSAVNETRADFDVEVAQDAVFDGLLSQGKLLSKKEVVVGTKTGLQFRMQADGEFTDGLLVMRGNIFYEIFIQSPVTQPVAEQELQRFFTSFQFLGNGNPSGDDQVTS